MKKNWMVLAMAMALTVSLTACGGNRNQTGGTTNGAGSVGSGSAANGSASNGYAGSGSVGDPYAGSGSVSDPYAGSGSLQNDSMGGGNPTTAPSGSAAGSGSQTRNSRTSYNGYTATRRTAYDYLDDGRYDANGDGQVNGQWNTAGRDLTQGARDLVRGAGNAIGDVGRGVGNAVGDVGLGVQNAARSATNY